MKARRRRKAGRRLPPLTLTRGLEPSRGRALWGWALCISLGIHVLPLMATAGGITEPAEPARRRLQMDFIEPPRPAPAQPQEARVEVPSAPPAPSAPSPKRRRSRTPPRRSASPPPPPASAPPALAPSPVASGALDPRPAAKPRRVGSLSSSSGGGTLAGAFGSAGGRGAPGAEGPGAGRNQASSRFGNGGAGSKWTKPERVSPLRPIYPPALRAQRLEGNVTVRVRIDAIGQVVDARIVAAAPADTFEAAALASARQERFRPATRDGRPAPYTLTFTYRFRIED